MQNTEGLGLACVYVLWEDAEWTMRILYTMDYIR